jgi:hypothetical protein
MNSSHYAFCPDDTFGPTVRNLSCRDGFDFTLLFEESIFTILPAALLLCALPLRFHSIYRRVDMVRWSRLRLMKLVSQLSSVQVVVASQADLKYPTDHHCCIMFTQTGFDGFVDALLVCCITVSRDNRRSSAGFGCYGRYRGFVASRTLEIAATLDCDQHFSFLHHHLGPCKSTNGVAAAGLIRFSCRIRRCTGRQVPVTGFGGSF